MRRIAPQCVLVAVTAAGLYWATFTNAITQDSISYAASAIKGGLADWLHPHHILYDALLACIARVTGATEQNLQSLRVLQGLNLLLSASAAGVFFGVVRRLSGGRRSDYLLAALFVLSNGFWLYSSQIEVYNVSVLCILGTLLALVSEEQTGSQSWIAPVITSTLALTFHQTSIFFTIALAMYGAFAYRNRERNYFLLRYTVVPLAIVGLLYVAAAWYVVGSPSPGTVWEYMTTYAHVGQWGRVEGKNFLKSLFGFVNSFLAIDQIRDGGLTLSLGVGMIVFGLGAGALLYSFRLRAIDRYRTRRYLGILIPWFVLHAVFVWWWYASNIEFWIAMIPCVLLTYASALGARLAESRGFRSLTMAGLACIVIAQTITNLGPIWRDRSEPSARVQTAVQLANGVSERDLVLITTHPGLVPFVQFFATGSVAYLFDLPGRSQVAESLEHMADLSRAIRETVGRGGRVIVEGDVMRTTYLGKSASVTEDDREVQQWLRRFEWRDSTLGTVPVSIMAGR